MPDLTGSMIGRYHLHEQLGKGGMAVVYKAFDTELERYVAIKIIRKDAFPENFHDQLLKRFKQEAKSLARLSHPNIVDIYDYGDFQGDPYLVLEYLPNGTLAGANKALAYQDALRIILPVAKALSYAHKNEILHRDIKPSNILLNAEGQPVLSDFGISKLVGPRDSSGLTLTGASMGTPDYMSPEQGLGNTIDARSDIYSLGIVLYELITGRRPFIGDTPFAVVLKHVNEPLPDPRQFVPDLPVDVYQMLRKMLAKSPQGRYKNADQLIEGLEAILSGKVGEYTRPVTEPQLNLPTLNVPLPQIETQAFTAKAPPEPLEQRPSFPVRSLLKDKRVLAPLGLAGVLAFALLLVFGVALSRRATTGAVIENTDPAVLNTPTAPATEPTEKSTLEPAAIAPSSPTLTLVLASATPMPATATITQAPTETAVPVIISRPLESELSGLKNIWGLIEYENLQRPGTITYQVPVAAAESYRWGAVWCAADAGTLVKILAPLSMELRIDGEKLTQEQYLEYETQSGWPCRRWVVKLSKWSPGSQVLLELNYVLSERIYDGQDYYEAGNYQMILEVKVE
jgi:eukaryotic-like serine/threonine-protein kinase